MTFTMIWRACPTCGTRFGQPDDPGRKRRYCADACKQAAYRARRRADDHAWRGARQRTQDYARRRQQRQHEEQAQAQDRPHDNQQPRAEQTRHHTRTEPPPSGTHARSWGPDELARARRIIDALIRKAERTTFPYEASACRAKAEELRRKYRL